MSVLVASTLRERASAKDVPIETVRQGACKGWVRFNSVPATPTVSESFNISSLGDGGVGNMGINLTTVLTGSGSVTGAANSPGVANQLVSVVAQGVSVFGMVISNVATPSTAADTTTGCGQIFGNFS